MMRKLLTLAACAVLVGGCHSFHSKSRYADIGGMYVSDTGQLAIGKVSYKSVPSGQDAAIFDYNEDTAWLNPSKKTCSFSLFLSGSNAVSRVDAVFEKLCKSFVRQEDCAEATPEK